VTSSQTPRPKTLYSATKPGSALSERYALAYRERPARATNATTRASRHAPDGGKSPSR
jgi:hypothetical protein